MPSEAFAERIVSFVRAKGYKPQQLHELAVAMGIGEDEQGDFHASCRALMRTGRVVLGSRGAIMLPPMPPKITGTYRANPRGFGFVIPVEAYAHGDLYVPVDHNGGAMTGDTVVAQVRKRGKRGGKMMCEGRVVEIVRRGQSRFVGELRRQFGQWLVVPDGNTVHLPIFIADVKAKKASEGDQVVVEIVEYPTDETPARGAILRVLGESGEPGVDTASVIEQYQLAGPFDEEVEEAASKIVQDYDSNTAILGREDLRKQTVITIDPLDAKDFDDAISLNELDDGTYELGVHIADVSYLVREGSIVDREARKRSTSVYLSGTVIPMLPEVISNGLCSLQEREVRLAKSAFIVYDKQGTVVRTRLANSVIKSTKRLTYEQAQKIIDGKPGRISAKVVALVSKLEKLSRSIEARRTREGMLRLDLPEVEAVYDDAGALIDVKPRESIFAHKLIEMFMVEANEAVARLMVEKKVPALRRVHEEPEDTAGLALGKFLGALGYQVSDDPDRSELQALLNKVRGKPEEFAANLAVLRSMQRAEYSPAMVGHYALASENYCHFTSPIRRYPDLVIHRLIDEYLATGFKGKDWRKRIPTEESLVELGKHCSTAERLAEAAERELKLVLTLRLLEDRLGDEFDGVVTGVVNIGVFVQLEHYLVEGLLRFDALPDDWWEVDSDIGAAVGERSGYSVRIGDRLRIGIDRIDMPSRRLDLRLAAPLPGKDRAMGKRGRRQSKGKPAGKSQGRPGGGGKGRSGATSQRKVRAKSGGKAKPSGRKSRSKTSKRRRK